MTDVERVRYLILLSAHYSTTQCTWVPIKVLIDAAKAVQDNRDDDYVRRLLNNIPTRTRRSVLKQDGPSAYVGLNTLDFFESGHVRVSDSDGDSDVSGGDNTGDIARPLKRGATDRASTRRVKKKMRGKFCLFNGYVANIVYCSFGYKSAIIFYM